MEKREKIIVIATVIIAAYGAIDFLFLSKNEEANIQQSPQVSSEIINTVAAQLASQPQDGKDDVKQLVSQIVHPWPENLFLKGSFQALLDRNKKDTETNKILSHFNPDMFIYSGFLQMGDNKMAIINGSDYKKGDNVNSFTLADITPKYIKVVLEDLPFEIPIQPSKNP